MRSSSFLRLVKNAKITMAENVGPLLWISSSEVRKALSWEVLVPAMSDTLAAFCTEGLVEQPLRLRIQDEENNGFKLVMPGLVRPKAALATKILTMYPDNHARNLPSHNAIIVLFDSHTGMPVALVDGNSVTELRTAAATAAATLAIRTARGDQGRCEVVAVVGAGVQGAAHARVMNHILQPAQIRIWSRGGSEQLTASLQSEGLPAVAADSLEAAVRGADVINTCTFKLDTLVAKEWVKQGAIINAVGAAIKENRELSTELLTSAVVFADSVEAARAEAGDIVETGVVLAGEVGRIISRDLAVPRGKVIIFKSLAMGDDGCAAVVEMQDWTRWSIEELERQYSPSQWSPHSHPSSIIEEYVEAAARDTAVCRGRLSWGTHAVAKIDADDTSVVMDVYGEDLPAGSKVVVYVHGGYWQELNKDLVGGLMGPLCDAGVVVVVLQYTTAPQGRVAAMVQEVRRGVVQARALALQRGWGPAVLVGWSAGAQLVLQALLHFDADSGLTSSDGAGVKGDVPPPVSWIRAVVTVSGVFLLTPLVDTYVNGPLQLSRSEAQHLSPLDAGNLHHLGKVAKQVNFLIAVADHDSPSFREQSLVYAQALRAEGFPSVTEVRVESSDHFKIVSQLADPSNSFAQELVTFVQKCCNA